MIAKVTVFGNLENRGPLIICFYFRSYFTMPSSTDQVLLIQCDSGDKNSDLIDCARFCITEEYHHSQNNSADEPSHPTKRHVMIIIQLPRVAGGCFTGFQVRDRSLIMRMRAYKTAGTTCIFGSTGNLSFSHTEGYGNANAFHPTAVLGYFAALPLYCYYFFYR